VDAWIVLLAIALLRGLGAWMKRRNEQQRRGDAQPGPAPSRPQPGDPDAFDLEDLDPYGEGQFTWEQEPPPPAPPRRLPTEERPRRPERPRRGRPEPEVVVLSDRERERQEMLQRLARAASEATPHLASSRERPKARHPVAPRGARIRHESERAEEIRRALLSPRRFRETILLREVLGPPVALRGPLRGPGSYQPR